MYSGSRRAKAAPDLTAVDKNLILGPEGYGRNQELLVKKWLQSAPAEFADVPPPEPEVGAALMLRPSRSLKILLTHSA